MYPPYAWICLISFSKLIPSNLLLSELNLVLELSKCVTHFIHVFIRDLTFSRRDFFSLSPSRQIVISSTKLDFEAMKSRIRIYFYQTGKHVRAWTWTLQVGATVIAPRKWQPICVRNSHVIIWVVPEFVRVRVWSCQRKFWSRVRTPDWSDFLVFTGSAPVKIFLVVITRTDWVLYVDPWPGQFRLHYSEKRSG